MANDTKIRLLISSALDASGIKATKGQLDQLSEKLGAVNRAGKGTGDAVAQSIGGIEGPAGKLQKALGGLAGKASMLFGAFMTGWQIGTKIRDQLAELWPAYNKYINGTDDWAAAQKRLNKALTESAKAREAAFAQSTADYEGERANADAAIKKIASMAEAYRAAQKAKSEFLNATESSEMQRLQRERFEDVATLQRAGEFAAADQVSAAYDIIEAELKAKQQMAAFDRESAQMTEKRAEAEQRIADRAETKMHKSEERLTKLQQDLAAFEDNGGMSAQGDRIMTDEEYEKSRQRMLAEIGKAMDSLDSDREEVARLARARRLASAADITRSIQRGTLADQLTLEADRARLAYDNITAANGNAAGLNWDKDYAAKVYDASMESYRQLVDVNRNTENLSAKLDELLQIKGGR